jgi:hypothetical protein
MTKLLKKKTGYPEFSTVKETIQGGGAEVAE